MRRALALLASLISHNAQAQDNPASSASSNQLWLTATVRSYHKDRSHGFNENNLGLGLEYRDKPWRNWIVGEYANSEHHTSVYVGAVMAAPPLVILGMQVRLGVILGAVTGYRHGNTPLVLPALSFERGRFGVNMTFIPHVFGAAQAIACQVKYMTSGF